MSQILDQNNSNSTDMSCGPSQPGVTRTEFCSRDELAGRLLALEPLIRNRIRRKLSASTRRIFDSQDLMSTLLRRVDRLASQGRLRATSQGELIKLLLQVAENALIDRARVTAKLRRVDGPDGRWAREMLNRIEAGSDEESADVIAAAFAALTHESDRFLLTLWLRGVPHVISAQVLGISPDAARQRWQNIRATLANHLKSRMTDENI
ncbi:MAG TPA: sigma-70 family RNA polymerase sigma factor [Phycisphaerales bacterium]|nr:sigma-70 family RNA polymerase sigma factor [Phycisphaerales bacterium]